MRFGARLVEALLGVLVGCTGSAPVPVRDAAPPADDRSLCAALCEHVAACGSRKDFIGVAACTKDCAEDPRQIAGPCREPRLAYEACAVTLPCAELQAMEVAPLDAPGPCADARKGLLACEPDAPLPPQIDFQF